MDLATHLLAPTLVAGPRNLRSLTRTLLAVAEIVIGVNAHLLTWRELEHVRMLLLVLG